MTFHIITLFPETFAGVFSASIVKRAIDKKLIKINFVNPRDFAQDKHKSVDEKPYGGGRGMIMRVDVIVRALASISPKPYSILLSASGKKYNQSYAVKLAKLPNLAIICGHYEGVDARVEKFVDDVISIGDFVLTGGEIPAMIIVDSVTRLIPGAIHPESLESESFSKISNFTFAKQNFAKLLKISNFLEYPQYTRPEDFQDLKVPRVLLSGNHEEIEQWRKREALKRTRKYRPDLLNAKRKTTKALIPKHLALSE